MRAVSPRDRRSRSRAIALTAAGDVSTPRLEISSLVDVAFLLLTFFLLTATLDPREADLGLTMAVPMPRPITDAENVVVPEDCRIVIDASGVVHCDEDVIETDPASRDLPHLFRHLESIRLADEMSRPTMPTRVFIDAADEVSGQRLVDVMNCLAKAGVTNVMLEGFRD